MKASELRIGNLVFFISKYEFFEVTDISSYNNTLSSEEYCRDLSEFQPIPLTEEWLVKFGFEKDDNGSEIESDYFQWYEMDFPLIGLLVQSDCKEYVFDENSDTLRIKYVHQLQNLYFALTGEELTLKN